MGNRNDTTRTKSRNISQNGIGSPRRNRSAPLEHGERRHDIGRADTGRVSALGTSPKNLRRILFVAVGERRAEEGCRGRRPARHTYGKLSALAGMAHRAPVSGGDFTSAEVARDRPVPWPRGRCRRPGCTLEWVEHRIDVHEGRTEVLGAHASLQRAQRQVVGSEKRVGVAPRCSRPTSPRRTSALCASRTRRSNGASGGVIPLDKLRTGLGSVSVAWAMRPRMCEGVRMRSEGAYASARNWSESGRSPSEAAGC